ncbi:MAG: hypothetical protein IKO61_12570 [Lachnospiraceae bacterium]|nr:hypothetical protein [Lachnospiraceae bacterium]
MAYKFDETMIKDYISMSSDDEELKELEEEYLEDYDELEVYRAHSLELYDLERLMDILKTIDEEYNPRIHAREAVENAYTMTIYLLLHLARRFNPLTSYALSMITKAKKLEERYVKLTEAPLVTGITEDNYELFSGLIDPDILEEIKNGRYRGIGLFKTSIDYLFPAACAVYRIIELSPEMEEGPVIDVKWFYVDEDERNGFLADLLMGKLIELLVWKDASLITMSVPVDEYYEKWLQLFAEWNFDVSPGINPEFRCRLSDVDNKKKLAKYIDDVTLFADVEKVEGNEVIRRYFKGSEESAVLDYIIREPEYYDTDLSCFLGGKNAPAGILLVHRKPSGTLAIEIFNRNPDSANAIKKLLATFFCNALVKYDVKTEVTLFPDNDNLEEFLDRIVTTQRVVPMIDATLSWPEMDISKEEVDVIMKEIEKQAE